MMWIKKLVFYDVGVYVIKVRSNREYSLMRELGFMWFTSLAILPPIEIYLNKSGHNLIMAIQLLRIKDVEVLVMIMVMSVFSV
jgi:hypothetical protein